VRNLAGFLWDFVVGDDPVIAAGVVLALGITAVLAALPIPAWWLLPVAVAGLLALSVWRARSESGPAANVDRAPQRVDGAHDSVLPPGTRM
jgi:hypothetical protein